MASTPETQGAWSGLVRSCASGRLGHAYLLTGPDVASLKDFALRFVSLVLCGGTGEKPCGACSACRRTRLGTHPDLLCLEPKSKSRQILVKDLEPVLHHLQQTAFEGGAKAVIIESVDRMNETACNKFLKTLEEPSANSLILLLSDQPAALLPTIISRCQRIWVPPDGGALPEPGWRDGLIDLLRNDWPSSLLESAALAARVEALLKGERDRYMEEETGAAEPETGKDVVEARVAARYRGLLQRVLTTVMDWQRDVLLLSRGVGDAALLHNPLEIDALTGQAQACSYAKALSRVQRCERMAELLERNIPAGVVMERGFSPV